MSSSAPISRPRPSRIDAVVVGDAGRGSCAPAPPARRSSPARARSATVSAPAGALGTRPASSVSPTWPSARAALALRRGANPRPSSATTSRVTPPAPARHVDAHESRAARALARCAAPRARRGRRARRAPSARRGRRRRARSRCRRPSSGLSRSPSAASQAGRLEVRRVDLDEQRAQVAHALAQPRDRGAQRARPPSASPRRSASSASGARPNATPARSCTTPSCRSAAIRRRSWADASTALLEQLLALAVAALQPPRQRPGQRHLEQQQHQQAGEQRRRERAQQALAARR